MQNDGKLTIHKNKTTNIHKAKIDALNSVNKEDEYLDGSVSFVRVDIDKRVHKAIKDLSNSTELVTQLSNGHIKTKSVSMKMLFTEAILDLFEKYKKGEGKYKFDEETKDWQFNK